ncbi:MAG: hypothetical protein IH594_12410, partial [Bacteroidales bacterium]|nr:hypothetical protein [Bacteroidales bacterium]
MPNLSRAIPQLSHGTSFAKNPIIKINNADTLHSANGTLQCFPGMQVCVAGIRPKDRNLYENDILRYTWEK